MTSSSLVDTVRQTLLSGYCVRFPCSEWLQQCVQFLIEENPQMEHSVDLLTGEVMSQLLDFDLCEIAKPSLPGHVTSCNKAVIKGPFLCQIQAIADVSQPFYRQYQELTKTYNRDCEMGSEDANGELNPTQAYSQRSANTFNNDANNKNGKRVLALKLTDGVVHVKGMEFVPIPNLDPLKILPGCKIILTNKIICRKGVLMLKPENVKILGGKVSTLIPSNTPLHLFATVLGKDENLKSILSRNPSLAGTQNGNDEPLPAIVQHRAPPVTENLQQRREITTGSTASNVLQKPESTLESLESRVPVEPPSPFAGNESSDAAMPHVQPVSNALDQVRTVSVDDAPNTNVSLDSLFDATLINEANFSNAKFQPKASGPQSSAQAVEHIALPSSEAKPTAKTPAGVPSTSTGDAQTNRRSCQIAPEKALNEIEPERGFTRSNGPATSPSQSLGNLGGTGFKPMQTSTPFVPKTYRKEELESSSPNIENLGGCSLADLKTCQFGPQEIQMSYLAEAQCRVDTLLSQLECDQGRMWSLRVRLIDKSATLDVAISSQVLEAIIGLSADYVFNCQKFIEEDNPEATIIKQNVNRVADLLQAPLLKMSLKYRKGKNEVPFVTEISKVSPWSDHMTETN